MFVGAHAMMAMILRTPELQISDDEGKAFMNATKKVMSHYSVETSQKTVDIVALIGVSATIYLPRFAMIRARKNSEKPQRMAPNPNNGAQHRTGPAAPAPQPSVVTEPYFPSVIPGEPEEPVH